MSPAPDARATATSPECVLEFDQVVFRRAEITVLDGITLRLARGETVALLGRSGGGKTTLLKLANGVLAAHAGQVSIEGRPTSAWDPIRLRRRTGYVMQEGGLFPHFTVARNIGLVPSLEGWSRDRIAARVAELMQLVSLPPGLAGRLPAELSGGQRQRVGFARALAGEPPLLLCDEPFGALDPLTRATMQKELIALRRALAERGTPTGTLFVTHDLREALVVADRIALLDEGRLVLVDTPAKMLASDHPLARAYRDTLVVQP